MAGKSPQVIVAALAVVCTLTTNADAAFAETIQFVDTLESAAHAPLKFDQVNAGMGKYSWEESADESATKLEVPPLIEGKQEAVEQHFTAFPWLTMYESPKDPNVKMGHPLGSVGRLSSSLVLLRNRKILLLDNPDGYQTGMNNKNSGSAYGAFRLEF